MSLGSAETMDGLCALRKNKISMQACQTVNTPPLVGRNSRVLQSRAAKERCVVKIESYRRKLISPSAGAKHMRWGKLEGLRCGLLYHLNLVGMLSNSCCEGKIMWRGVSRSGNELCKTTVPVVV